MYDNRTKKKGCALMFTKNCNITDKNEAYKQILLQLPILLDDAPNKISALSNTCALLNVYLEDINWVGFYLMEKGTLVLGPFQGLPACSKIALGSGVCGTSALEKKIYCVPDVHQFPGHIACDGNSRSEIVLPLIVDKSVVAVLDIDSPCLNRFDKTDESYLSQIVQLLANQLYEK